MKRVAPPVMRKRQLRNRGQAVVELALVLPIVLVLWATSVDGARAFTTQLEVRGAARAGIIDGIQSQDETNGITIRDALGEYNGDPPNAVWGWDDFGGNYAHCNSDANPDVGGICGDPGGCGSSSPFWGKADGANGLPEACFSVGWCAVAGDALSPTQPACTPPTTACRWSPPYTPCWGQRPPDAVYALGPGGNPEITFIDVHVCIQFRPTVISTGSLRSPIYICGDALDAPSW